MKTLNVLVMAGVAAATLSGCAVYTPAPPPPAVVVRPAPYYGPPPVVYAPPPAYYGPPSVGFYGRWRR